MSRNVIGIESTPAQIGGSARGYLGVRRTSQQSRYDLWIVTCSVYLYNVTFEANARICRDDVASRRRSFQLGNHLMVRDPFVPAAQRSPGSVLDDGLFVVVSGEAADGVQAGEERDGGEHDLLAILLAQQAGTAESADRTQVLADLGFVMTPIVVGSGQRRPAAPYPRDHLPS